MEKDGDGQAALCDPNMSSWRPGTVANIARTAGVRVQPDACIPEASRRLPGELKARDPAIAWKEMAGAGYVYHDYEDVAASYVWSTVRNHLPPLRVVVTQEPAALDPSVG